ncbi:MAG: MBL fold metallo-hydrolase [Blautia sp.]|nr:MBL fold metallo-hydrolase [Blautia sp.]MCM1201778.1 MBL fold metallo-hydrolase [Bacteroides fragilis]
MKIVVLMEDTCGNPVCEYEHGLSVYVETGKHKLLMDTGASEKTLDNARKLGIALSQVDTVVLSHGHYDHSGGLAAFGKQNPEAVVYVQEAAFGDYYHGERYIGVAKDLIGLPGIKTLEGDKVIDEELSVFTGITGRRYWPQSNLTLSEMVEGKRIQDEFRHEQCLVIRGEKNLLLSGCAHNGILNILDGYQERYGGQPDIVVSGFHMMKKTDYTEQEAEIIRRTAQELAKKDILFYTGHCTGRKAIGLMQPIMKEKLIPLHCGMEIRI